METRDAAVSSSVHLESPGESPRRGSKEWDGPPPAKKRATAEGSGSSADEEDEGSSSESEIDSSVLETSSKNTQSNNRWALRTFVRWQKMRIARSPEDSEERPPAGLLKSSDPELLCKWLALFADEVRKKDGSYYPGKTVYMLLAGLHRYMSTLNPSCPNFLADSPLFKPIHDAFARERSNAVELKINRSLGKEEQEKLLASGTLSVDTPYALLQTLYVLNAKSFGLHSIKHQRKLKLSFLKRMTDPLRYVYIEQPLQSLSSMSRAKTNKTVRALTDAQEGNLCHVRILDFYLKKIPPEAFEKDVFYLKPVKECADSWASTEHWFTAKPLGRAAVTKLVREIHARADGLDSSSCTRPSPSTGFGFVAQGPERQGSSTSATVSPSSLQSPPVSATPQVFVVQGSDSNISPTLPEGEAGSQPKILTASSAVSQNVITHQQKDKMLEIARATPNPTNQPLFFIPATCTVAPSPPGNTSQTQQPDAFQIPPSATITSPHTQPPCPSTHQTSAVPQPQPEQLVIDLTGADAAPVEPPIPKPTPTPTPPTNPLPLQSPPQAKPSRPARVSEQQTLLSNLGLPQLVFNNCHVSIFVTQPEASSSTNNEE